MQAEGRAVVHCESDTDCQGRQIPTRVQLPALYCVRRRLREMSERLGHLHNDAFVPRMPFALCVAQPLCLPRKRICRLLSLHSRAQER